MKRCRKCDVLKPLEEFHRKPGTGDGRQPDCKVCKLAYMRPWKGALTREGYGQFTLDGRRTSAHRAAYLLLAGPIPDELHLDHLCRNPQCVNPGHMEPVTPAENIRRGWPATKTHCVNGHVLDGRKNNGRRYCTECARAANRRSAAKRREREVAR